MWLEFDAKCSPLFACLHGQLSQRFLSLVCDRKPGYQQTANQGTVWVREGRSPWLVSGRKLHPLCMLGRVWEAATALGSVASHYFSERTPLV